MKYTEAATADESSRALDRIQEWTHAECQRALAFVSAHSPEAFARVARRVDEFRAYVEVQNRVNGCLDCGHAIRDHTARVGEDGRVCATCDCYRYSGELVGDAVMAEWRIARTVRPKAYRSDALDRNVTVPEDADESAFVAHEQGDHTYCSITVNDCAEGDGRSPFGAFEDTDLYTEGD